MLRMWTLLLLSLLLLLLKKEANLFELQLGDLTMMWTRKLVWSSLKKNLNPLNTVLCLFLSVYRDLRRFSLLRNAQVITVNVHNNS